MSKNDAYNKYVFGMSIFLHNRESPLVLRSNDLNELKIAHKLLYRAGYALRNAPYSDGQFKLNNDACEEEAPRNDPGPKHGFIYYTDGCLKASTLNATAGFPFKGKETWKDAMAWARRHGCVTCTLRDDTTGMDEIVTL